MPHDRNGREILVGDFIKAFAYNDKEGDVNGNPQMRTGIVISIRANEQECTGQFLYFNNSKVAVTDYYGAKDCLLLLRGDKLLNYGSIDSFKFRYGIKY